MFITEVIAVGSSTMYCVNAVLTSPVREREHLTIGDSLQKLVTSLHTCPVSLEYHILCQRLLELHKVEFVGLRRNLLR